MALKGHVTQYKSNYFVLLILLKIKQQKIPSRTKYNLLHELTANDISAFGFIVLNKVYH